MRASRRTGERSLGQELARRAEDFLVDLLGAPTSRTANEWRYRRRGSLACKTRGPARGLFFDHEAGEGGDLVALLAIVRGLTIADACKEASAWLGSSSPLGRLSSPVLTGEVHEAKPRAEGGSLRAHFPPPASLRSTTSPVRTGEESFELALALWDESTGARGTLVERYLNARGLSLPPSEDIRFHPRLLHMPTCKERPAMVALMRDIKTNQPTGIHRTYLSADGLTKAHCVPQKMMLGRAALACVKLAPDDAVTEGLAIAEGIETAIAAHMIGWTSVWAALSANALKHFPILEGIEALTIFADHDAPGLASAHTCAARWAAAGREVIIRTPLTRATDLADAAEAWI